MEGVAVVADGACFYTLLACPFVGDAVARLGFYSFWVLELDAVASVVLTRCCTEASGGDDGGKSLGFSWISRQGTTRIEVRPISGVKDV